MNVTSFLQDLLFEHFRAASLLGPNGQEEGMGGTHAEHLDYPPHERFVEVEVRSSHACIN